MMMMMTNFSLISGVILEVFHCIIDLFLPVHFTPFTPSVMLCVHVCSFYYSVCADCQVLEDSEGELEVQHFVQASWASHSLLWITLMLPMAACKQKKKKSNLKLVVHTLNCLIVLIFGRQFQLISIIPTGNNKLYRGLYVGTLTSNVINFDYQFFSKFVLALHWPWSQWKFGQLIKSGPVT